jgi:hypothetical protein
VRADLDVNAIMSRFLFWRASKSYMGARALLFTARRGARNRWRRYRDIQAGMSNPALVD